MLLPMIKLELNWKANGSKLIKFQTFKLTIFVLDLTVYCYQSQLGNTCGVRMHIRDKKDIAIRHVTFDQNPKKSCFDVLESLINASQKKSQKKIYKNFSHSTFISSSLHFNPQTCILSLFCLFD